MKRFTIVTPSFNQAAYLPRTLASISAQTFNDYEHLIFDPGSSDGSVLIAEAYCQSEPRATLHVGRDKSQTHAINLGFAEAKGDILCWLNSDDRYASPDVLEAVATEFSRDPAISILYGRGTFVDPEGRKLKDAFVHRNADGLRNAFANSLGILQPSLFMRRSVFEAVGPLDQRMNYSFDYEYWARCAAMGISFRFIDRVLSEAVIHEDAKTMRARGISLAESSTVARRYYNYVSLDWIRRIVDQEHSGADGITASSQTVPEDQIAERFRRDNTDVEALARFFNDDPTMNAATRKGFADWIVPSLGQVYVSAWDANYFDMGVTLLASIHRHDPGRLIFVCDVGMTETQRAFLKQVRDVVFLEQAFPAYSADWQRNPKNYVFKTLLSARLADMLTPGTCLLWIDAGVALCRGTESIFNLIQKDGYFFIDHDDNRHWPFFNASFTSDSAIGAAGFTWAEMAGPHVISCLYGLRTGGPGHEIIREAAKLAHLEAVAVGDKHPPESEKKKALDKTEQARLAAGLAENTNPVDNLDELRRVFGYYGHRQDQSILSALVARHGASISSARTYCPANDVSSEVSKENWFEGVSRRLGQFHRNDFNSAGVTFHHRGLVKDFSGLLMTAKTSSTIIIFGNRPPNFKRVSERHDCDTICTGLHIREWLAVGCSPSIYVELNPEISWQIREDILELLKSSFRTGIRLFVLRDHLIKWLSGRVALDRVLNFDLVDEGFPTLHSHPISSGSHAVGLAQAMGYETIVVAGFDYFRSPDISIAARTVDQPRIQSWLRMNRSRESGSKIVALDSEWLGILLRTDPTPAAPT